MSKEEFQALLERGCCRHCGRSPSATLMHDEVWPWFAVRVGPMGKWKHHYCSEKCWAHADEYSVKAWDENKY